MVLSIIFLEDKKFNFISFINILWVSTVFSTPYLFLDTAARLQWPVTQIGRSTSFFIIMLFNKCLWSRYWIRHLGTRYWTVRDLDETIRYWPHLVLLDAKAAFDKVIHSHLFRHMYHAGIQDKTWTIIKSLHHNAESCIRWTGSTSDCFKVGMGVRQGGILSTDLYKLYINPLLDRLQDVGIGLKIRNIR